jgi:peptidoglycan/xylan/chitin deacetylase (PgdA/CDA1 family)
MPQCRDFGRFLGTHVNPRPKKLRLLRWLPKSLMLTDRPRGGSGLYLTFDDGPHPEVTPALLDLLAENGAKATFFLLGDQVERHPGIVRRMVDEGHVIGNHSYNHPRFPTISTAEQRKQVDRTDTILAAFDGNALHWFRPPSGAMSMLMLFTFALRRRAIAYWSYDTMDYRREPADVLVRRLRADPPQAGDVVLLHDDEPNTVLALRELLPTWRASGLSLDALPPESR